MAGKKQLPPVRLATDDDAPAPVERLSLSAAFEQGDELSELLAKRRILIAHITNPNTLARDLAALTRRDDELAKQIKTLRALRAEKSKDESSVSSSGDEAFDPYSA